MAGFLASLFAGGASTLVESVGKAIDSVVTSDEEKISLENELRRAEMSHKAEMRLLDIEETGLFINDISSAREEQSRVQESENASWLAKNIQPFLALLLVVLTFFMFGRALFGGIAANSHESNITMMILGALISIDTQIVSYFFGASRDSINKDMKNIPVTKSPKTRVI